jgi:hypothetical protein
MKLDDKAFEAAVRKRVADNPDTVYQPPSGAGGMCVYVEKRDNELVGSCLIGCALLDLGVPAEKINYGSSSPGVHDVNLELGLGLSSETLRWAEDAQVSQDQKFSWGESLTLADQKRERSL